MKTFLILLTVLMAANAKAGDLSFNKTIAPANFGAFLTHLEADTGLKFRGTCANEPNPSCTINGWVSYSGGKLTIHIHESAIDGDTRIAATQFNQTAIDAITASVGSFQ